MSLHRASATDGVSSLALVGSLLDNTARPSRSEGSRLHRRITAPVGGCARAVDTRLRYNCQGAWSDDGRRPARRAVPRFVRGGRLFVAGGAAMRDAERSNLVRSTCEDAIILPKRAFELRALVAALGERSQPPWWRTEFLFDTGLRFLERVYPRVYFGAAVHAAGRAAAAIHDRFIGRRGVFHLFRLPPVLEEQVALAAGAWTSARSGVFGPHDEPLDRLRELAGGQAAASPGPICLGSEALLFRPEGYRRLAACYAAGFSEGFRVFPYFLNERGEVH